jgi:hypothetical protein
VAEFKYLGTTLTNPDCIHEEIKGSLNSRNVCYHWVQNPLSSCFPSKKRKFKVYRILILAVVFYWCWTWLLTLREELGWGCLRIGCWWRYLGQGWMRYQGSEGNCTLKSFIIGTLHSVLSGWSRIVKWVEHVAPMGSCMQGFCGATWRKETTWKT